MGLTSRAKMQQMGVSEVIWGRLTDAMRLEEGGEMSHARYTHPRVEPEIAYIMRKPLSGNVSLAEALDAVEAVAPAMEIIDSRYRNFKFALADVIAAKLLSGKAPTIRRALAFTACERQQGLKPIDILGNPDYRIDPNSEDFYLRLIELRSSIKRRRSALPAGLVNRSGREANRIS